MFDHVTPVNALWPAAQMLPSHKHTRCVSWLQVLWSLCSGIWNPNLDFRDLGGPDSAQFLFRPFHTALLICRTMVSLPALLLSLDSDIVINRLKINNQQVNQGKKHCVGMGRQCFYLSFRSDSGIAEAPSNVDFPATFSIRVTPCVTCLDFCMHV